MNEFGSIFSTVFGWCGIVAGERGLKRVILPLHSKKKVLELMASILLKQNDLLVCAENLIKDYFKGRKIAFNLPLELEGFSDFQKSVYEITRLIPYGEVKTYSEVARQIGNPGAFRAVGTALARNPVPLFIPCHRVIRSDGRVGGFSSPSGTIMKTWLLQLEGIIFKK